MDTRTENKLNMYKAVETVCTSNHTEWNSLPEFGSAFSRFAVKVAQLDLLSDDSEINSLKKITRTSSQIGERMQKLMLEIDHLLRTSIDSFVKFLQDEHRDFYSMYVSARTRC